MTGLRDLGLRWKVAGHLALILLVVIGNLGVVWWFVQEQSDAGTAINEAGEQRMLVNQMRLKAHLIGMGDATASDAPNEGTLRADLAADITDFDRTLTALIEGDDALGISPAPPPVREQLRTVRETWRPFRTHLEVIMTEPRTSRAFRESLSYVQTHHAQLLAQTDEAVSRYEASFNQRIDRLQTILAVLLGLDLLVVPLLFGLIDRRILQPIERITAASRSIANGDMDGQIPVIDTDNKVGTLSRSLGEMKDQLVSAISEARRFEQAVEHAGHAIYITDTDGRIEYVNPAFEELTNYREVEAIGATPRILNSGQQPESFFEERWDTLEAGGVWEEEIVNRRASGELFHAHQTIGPITDDTDEVVGYVAILSDRTTEIVSNQQNQVLSRVLRHNLRTELNVILLSVKELVTTNDTATREEHADKIEDRIDNLVDLSDKTDRFTRTLNRDEDWHQRLCSVVERVSADMTDRFPEAAMTVETPDPEIDVKANVELATEVLVENAIVYNDQPVPEVEIAVTLTNGSGPGPNAVLTVSDNGPGIPDEERTVIEEGEETPLFHGSGLGLWIVHWTVTLAGGQVEIIDREPRGTTVSITLPHASVRPFPRDTSDTSTVKSEYQETESNHND